jgi:hypothetical protein
MRTQTPLAPGQPDVTVRNSVRRTSCLKDRTVFGLTAEGDGKEKPDRKRITNPAGLHHSGV